VTTKTPGGKITGLLALTLDTGVAYSANVGDWVELSADYTVVQATGTKQVLGRVSVKNVKRTSSATSTTYPVGNPGGQVTVEVPGFAVHQVTADATIVAGDIVVIGAAGTVRPITTGVVPSATEKVIGIALTGATATNSFDLLHR